jgi:transposase-like protein
MKTQERAPETLTEAINYFSDADRALAFVASLRWPSGTACPHCESKEVGFLKTRRIWKCRDCHKQFSVKVGTIFEDSPLGLDKWLPAMWLIVNCKNGVSSYEIARALGVTQKTAWFMLHRIRLAMQTQTFSRMGGDVEVDETFIGGRGRYMHRDKKAKIPGRGSVGKAVVMGLLERNAVRGKSRVKAKVVRNIRRRHLQPEVRAEVTPGSSVYTDALASYTGLDAEYIHQVIDHAEAYAKGNVHTNGLENFWCLLKRTIRGTYVSVEPFHLFRYLDEQCFRFNLRGGNDGQRFVHALGSILGRRLTYKALTGDAVLQTC